MICSDKLETLCELITYFHFKSADVDRFCRLKKTSNDARNFCNDNDSDMINKLIADFKKIYKNNIYFNDNDYNYFLLMYYLNYNMNLSHLEQYLLSNNGYFNNIIYRNHDFKFYFNNSRTTYRNHSRINNISTIVNLVVYDVSSKINVINIKNMNYDVEKFTILFVASGFNDMESEEEYIENGNRLIRFNYTGNVVDIIDVINDSLDKYDAIVCPEMAGNEKIYEELKKINPKRSIIIGPSFHKKENNDVYNLAVLVAPNNVKYDIKKVEPYTTKYDGVENTYREDISNGKEYLIIDIDDIGRFLVLICSDYFNNDIDSIIINMDIDVVLILANTTQYGGFKRKNENVIVNGKRAFILFNHCKNIKYNGVPPLVISDSENHDRICKSFNPNCINSCGSNVCSFSINLRRNHGSLKITDVKYLKNKE